MFDIGTMTTHQRVDFLTELGFKYEEKRGLVGSFQLNCDGLHLDCYDTTLLGSDTVSYTFIFKLKDRPVVEIDIINEIWEEDKKIWYVPPYMASCALPKLLVNLHKNKHSPWEFRETILNNLDLLSDGINHIEILDYTFWFKMNYRRSKFAVGDPLWQYSEVKITEIDHGTSQCKLSDDNWYSLGVVHAATLPGVKILNRTLRTVKNAPKIIKGLITNSTIGGVLNNSPHLGIGSIHDCPLVFDCDAKMVRGSQVVI